MTATKNMVAFSLDSNMVELIDQKIAGIQKDLCLPVPLSRAAICKSIIAKHLSS